MAEREPDVILFDLPSGDVPGKNVCWSLNPWKTRLALNYKQISYTTKFIEYPDLRPYFSSLGIPPNQNAQSPTSEYTIPTIYLPSSKKYIMDSRLIISELERLYPTPSLHLEAPELKEVEAQLGPAMAPLRFIAIPRIGRNVLSEGSKEYFQRTRKEAFGMSLDEVERVKGGEEQYEVVRENWRALAEIVGRDAKGPFVLGDEISYTDFVIVSAMHFARRAGEDIYGRIIQMYPVLESLYDACKPWLERDDH